MEPQVEQALKTDRTIDITTIGRKSGEPRRIEIWFHNVEGALFITGTPGPRSWYANLVENPAFTFHLKESAQADLPATAMPVQDEDRRREILGKILHNLGRDDDVEKWVVESPLVEVVFGE